MNTYWIYAIVNRKTGDAYVGTTRAVARRWQEHQWKLARGLHSSVKLQDAWYQDGPEAFEFVIIWTILDATPETARRSELYWVAKSGTYNELKADLVNGRLVMTEFTLSEINARRRETAKNPQFRALMAEYTKQRWEDPEKRKPLLRGLQNSSNAGFKRIRPVKSPEEDARHAARMKELWADPDRNAFLKARLAARWKDPEAKARQAEKMRAFHAARRAMS
jgi:hypothetical protein